ncbi:MAG: hypothetical protein HS108_08470 [Planctomycetes bacterium]|nr:hypothetical protein [Planctomycetota bacterium]MCL4729629.1 hypothetical protein [Planctomycetota bacterium]
MKARLLLLPLSALAALAALALWLGLESRPAHAPSGPTSNDADTMAPNTPHADISPVTTTPAVQLTIPALTLGDPGLTATVTNDPHKGEVWLRILDDVSGRPLAHTECELWGAYVWDPEVRPGASFNFEGDVLDSNLDLTSPRRVVPLRVQTTDAQGLLRLTATPATLEARFFDNETKKGLQPEGTRKQVSGFDVDFPPDEVGFLFPVPRHCEPVTDPLDLATQILDLRRQPSVHPLDVRVRRAPILSGRVFDQTGAPLSGVNVFAFPLEVSPRLGTWMLFQDAFYQDMRHFMCLPGQTLEWFLAEHMRGLRNPTRHCLYASTAPPHHPGGTSRQHEHSVRGCVQGVTGPDGCWAISLPCRGKWLVGCYRHDTTYSELTRTVESDTELEFRLSVEPFGAIEVLVHYDSQEADEPLEMDLAVTRVGPTGVLLPLSDNVDRLFCAKASPTAPARLHILRVPAGLWNLAVSAAVSGFEDWHDSRLTQVEAGRTTRVEFRPAHVANGTLRPFVYMDGRLVATASFYSRHETSAAFRQHLVTGTNEQPPECKLPAGIHQLYFQGMEPVQCTIHPNATTTLRVDLPVAIVEFSINTELFQLLCCDSADTWVWLNLNAVDEWRDALHLTAIGGLMDADNEEHDRLQPGRLQTWRLPPGNYLWELCTSSETTLTGVLSVRAGRSAVQFALHNLPGLGAVRVDLAGFTDENQPDISVDELLVPDCLWRDWEHSGRSEPSIFYPTLGPGPDWYYEVNVFRSDRNTIWLVTGYGRSLSVTCTWSEAETDHQVTYGTAVPGKLQFARRDSTGEGNLVLTTPENDFASYDLLALSGNHTARKLRKDSNQLPQGTWHVVVRRSTWLPDEGRTLVEHAAVDIHLGEELELDLGRLRYHASGRLVVHLTGRGRTTPGRDPWWESDKSLEFADPVIEHLDFGPSRSNPARGLGQPSHIVFGTPGNPKTMILAYDPLQLAPGRYRLLPWFGAPANLGREFTIQPGQTVTITLTGG